MDDHDAVNELAAVPDGLSRDRDDLHAHDASDASKERMKRAIMRRVHEDQLDRLQALYPQ